MYNARSVEEGVEGVLDPALLSGINPAQTLPPSPDASGAVGVKHSAGSVLELGGSVKIFSPWERSDVSIYLYSRTYIT